LKELTNFKWHFAKAAVVASPFCLKSLEIEFC